MNESPYVYRRGPSLVCVQLRTTGKCQGDIPTPVYDSVTAEAYREGWNAALAKASEVVGRKE